MLRNSSRRMLVDTISQASRSVASCSLSVALRSVMPYLNKNSSSSNFLKQAPDENVRAAVA
jgi:hypothetical protein